MAGGDVRHPGRILRRTTTGLVLVVLVLAVVARGYDLGPRVLGWGPDPVGEPAEVAPPAGLTLPEPVAAEPVAPTAETLSADPAKVRRALGRLLRDEDLGPRVAVTVDELADGGTVFDTGPDRVTPASTLKILTSTAALAALGGDHTFRTTTVAGATTRDVILVGGGDPLLARSPEDGVYPPRADLTTLAKATALSLKELGRVRVRLGYDTSLFEGPAVSSAWRPSYVPDNVVSPISSLWVDEGRETPGLVFRAEDPALAAATELRRLLVAEGIEVVGRPRPAVAPEEAREYAAVQGAPLAQVVQWVLEVSDNEAAEVLFRHVAIAEGREASFAGGSAAVRDVLERLGIDTTGARILDGSGLSRRNRLAPDTLLAVLAAASSRDHPELRPVVANLPVAGFTGSLAYRFHSGDEEGLGVVRAKTGTLTGVHALAGTVTAADGVVLSFVAIADRVRKVDTLDARQTLDEVAAALAACSCAA
jgi:D-alanyl-D-alanine carboxypeptidase/D-alanyl-D-alanine-endopeptidase (penicillin-binding protein 4)